MRIGVNAVPLHYVTGGARHVLFGLLGQFLKAENPHRYVIFCHPSAMTMLREAVAFGGDRAILIPVTDEEQVYPHRDLFQLYFSPLNSHRPRVFDRPTVAILHDIQEQYFPQYFSYADLMSRYETYPEICRSATIVVAVSEFSKRCFVEKFNVDPRKIEVMHIAAQEGLVSADANDEGEWPDEPVPHPYLLYPANCYPHKNHGLLLDAIEKCANEKFPLSAIFTGNEIAGGYPLAEQIKARGLEKRCRFFTDLSVARMRHLYRHALATVMPTMYEGFGMPALEALACGCPLVCSDIPPLREIAGEQALYFKPGDMAGLCEQLARIVSDDGLRNRRIEGGYEAAGKFSWEAAGKKMLEVFATAERRFKYGVAEQRILPQPRIGILVREKLGGEALRQTLKSIEACGYEQCAVAILGQDGKIRQVSASDDCARAGADSALASLLDFASQSQLDLVGEAIEGSRLRPSALDSLAVSFQSDPQRSVHLGEAAVWRGKRFAGVANLRLTGDQMWTMSGMLYPEMMFLAPAALSKWNADKAPGVTDGALWRWQVLCAAQFHDQLALVRCTFADCQSASWLQKLRAYRAGLLDFHRLDNRRVPVPLLRRFEQPARMLSTTLPLSLQRIGTQIWYRITR